MRFNPVADKSRSSEFPIGAALPLRGQSRYKVRNVNVEANTWLRFKDSCSPQSQQQFITLWRSVSFWWHEQWHEIFNAGKICANSLPRGNFFGRKCCTLSMTGFDFQSWPCSKTCNRKHSPGLIESTKKSSLSWKTCSTTSSFVPATINRRNRSLVICNVQLLLLNLS